MTTSLTDLSIADASAGIAAKQFSPVELTSAYLEQIAVHNPQLNAYLLVNGEQALEQAHVAEAEIGRGDYRGALHGIPLAVKDLYETQGLRTTAGSAFLRSHISPGDAAAVRKLYAAGAVLLGKLNMHEWALGVIGDNPHYGVCRNPHDPDRICGGSSSGSAAAVAAHLTAGALGSDTRGSIRIPAAHCGIVGLKPTYGRVSLNGVYPLSWNLDHGGPMTRTVEDAALLLNAIAGYDADDPYSVDKPVEDFTVALKAGISGWRVAYDVGTYTGETDIVSAEVQASYRHTIAQCRVLGAQLHEVDMEFVMPAITASKAMVGADAAAFHDERLTLDADLFGADVLTRLRQDPHLTAYRYARDRHYQALLRRQFERFFREYDVLLLPSAPFAAVRRDDAAGMDKGRTHYTRFTAPFSFIGVPAVSVPCGIDSQTGMPLGVQIVGGMWQEAKVLRAAWAWEQQNPLTGRTPAGKNLA